MKRKYWIFTILLLVVISLCGCTSSLPTSLSTGVCLVTTDGTCLLVCDNSPIILSDRTGRSDAFSDGSDLAVFTEDVGDIGHFVNGVVHKTAADKQMSHACFLQLCFQMNSRMLFILLYFSFALCARHAFAFGCVY